MTRTLSTLALAALTTLTACDAPDTDTADATPRGKVLHADPASLAALAESDSAVHEQIAAQFELGSDRLLEMALDPSQFAELTLTAPPPPSLASEQCVGITDFLDFCFDKRTSGVYLWIEVLGEASPKDYFGMYGGCDSGGLDVYLASVSYTYCYYHIPVKQAFIGAEVCWPGDCKNYFYAKFFE